MSKYVLPAKFFVPLGEVAEPRQVFDTLEEAAAAYKSGPFGPMLEWKGPFNGPFPLCREWHGYSNVAVTGMSIWPPDCIYEIDVETTQEAERLYDVWQYMVKQAAEQRAIETEIVAPELSTREPYTIIGELRIYEPDEGDYLKATIEGFTHALVEDIADHFFDDWQELDYRRPVSLGQVRVIVELLEQPLPYPPGRPTTPPSPAR